MNPTVPHAAYPALRCPKCAADMATYERSGIVVDQCRECRGIFLDRGELERLVDAESAGAGWAGPRMPAAPPPGPLPRQVEPRWMPGDARAGGFQRRDDDDDDDRDRDHRRGDWDDRGRWEGRGKPRKRGGILGELLESLGD